MLAIRLPAAALVSVAMSLATLTPAVAMPAPRTLVIGVDHEDPANQDVANHRVFEYTDFFSRNVRVHSGDTLDFRTAPNAFHVVALAGRSEYKARVAYPVLLADFDDPNAPGTDKPPIIAGPGFNSITGGNSKTGGGQLGNGQNVPPGPCGFSQFGQSPCVFTGGDDVESQGGVPGFPPTGTDWQITINAGPGTYTMFCTIHPNMNGDITVVKDTDTSVSSQAQIDAASQVQFLADQAAALAAEQAANHVQFTGGAPGKRTYKVAVGIAAADNHVSINEMLPQQLNLTRGDAVDFKWLDEHNVHTVSFPADSPALPQPFAPDFEPGEGFELQLDPGNAGKGTVLIRPDVLVDSGVLVGRKYYVQPSAQFWGVKTNDATGAGTYEYQCTIHDFMHGKLIVGP